MVLMIASGMLSCNVNGYHTFRHSQHKQLQRQGSQSCSTSKLHRRCNKFVSFLNLYLAIPFFDLRVPTSLTPNLTVDRNDAAGTLLTNFCSSFQDFVKILG